MEPPDTVETAEVAISNRQRDVAIDEAHLTSLAQTTLRGEGIARAELSLSFVTPEEMTQLHERYLGEPGPTDVLSFHMDETDGDLRVLGDVVICPAFAAGNNPDVGSELRLLVVHGILHLLGYDHEEDEERAAMWARQQRYSGVTV
jgi:probable rRNA maturation factor